MSPPAAEPARPAPAIVERWLPYVENLARRSPDAIRLVVIHCTELPDLATAREYGERRLYASDTGNSGHFYIDRDGRIECWVPEQRVAHHVRGHNEHSIGIELVNRGRWPDWYDSRRQAPTEPYPDTQVDATIELLRWLQRQLPSLASIVGHDELDGENVEASDDPGRTVRRKMDPGPLFPWPRVIAATGLSRLDDPDRTMSRMHQ